jgi:hypothetical protein
MERSEIRDCEAQVLPHCAPLHAGYAALLRRDLADLGLL